MENRRIECEKRWEAQQAVEKEKIDVMKELIKAITKKE